MVVRGRLRRRLGSLLLALGLCGLPSSADAQDADAAARVLFERARTESERGDDHAARALLERSMELAPRIPTAFNLALVRTRVHDYAAARSLLLRLRSGEFGAISPALSERVGTELVTIEALCARVDIVLLRPPEAQLVGLGRARALTEGVNSVWLNPTAGALRVEATGYTTWSDRIELSAGERRRIDVSLTEASADSVTESSVDTGVVVGIVIAVTLAVGAAVAIPLSVHFGTAQDVVTDPVWGRVEF